MTQSLGLGYDIKKDPKQFPDANRAKGTQATLNGQPVFWTGQQYVWQSGPSALKNGLLGSEVVGQPAAPVEQGRKLGTEARLKDRPVFWTGDVYGWQSGETAVGKGLLTPEQIGWPNAPTLPAPQTQTQPPASQSPATQEPAATPQPEVRPEQTAQFQQATRVAKAYQNQVSALQSKLGGAAGLEALANLSKAPAAPFAAPGVEQPVQLGLSDYYTAQRAVGENRFNQENKALDSVISELGYDENMKKWAMANPMLAQREYARLLASKAQQTPAAPAETKVLSGQGLAGNVIDNPVS